MLNLQTRTLAAVYFKRTLPAYLANDPKALGTDQEVKCFIHIKSVAAGVVNPAYAAAMERLAVKMAGMQRALEGADHDATAAVEAEKANWDEYMRDRAGILFDTCDVEWETNILSNGKPLTCDAESFIALLGVKGVPTLSSALVDFFDQCEAAGKTQLEADEALAKN